MLEFAVTVNGVTKEGQAQWVLAIDPVGERLLIVHEDKSMHWHPLAECAFARVILPDAPRPVIPVQMPQQPTIAVPGFKRADPRRMLHNGN